MQDAINLFEHEPIESFDEIQVGDLIKPCKWRRPRLVVAIEEAADVNAEELPHAQDEDEDDVEALEDSQDQEEEEEEEEEERPRIRKVLRIAEPDESRAKDGIRTMDANSFSRRSGWVKFPVLRKALAGYNFNN